MWRIQAVLVSLPICSVYQINGISPHIHMKKKIDLKIVEKLLLVNEIWDFT